MFGYGPDAVKSIEIYRNLKGDAMNVLLRATDLTHWADRRDSQGTLPELIRRLIFASVPMETIYRIDFPAGDSVSRPGFDGILQVTKGYRFVPQGQSVWEMGVDRKPKQKAEADYAKRTADPGGLATRETTFVFVTPRRWPEKREWAAEKSHDGRWREVRAYDADDLEQWLQLCPSVAVWACCRIRGLPVDGMRDLGSLWADCCHRTIPPIVPQLFLAGREDAVKQVRAWLGSPSRMLRVRAGSSDEAVGFLAAVVCTLDEIEGQRVRSRIVFVSTAEAWRSLVAQQTPLILVAESPELGPPNAAVNRGHHVFVPYGNDSPGASVDIDLPPARRGEIEAVLRSMGIDESRARSLVHDARGRLPALIDLLGGGQGPPAWAAPEQAPALLPLFLAGSWSESVGDWEALETLAGVDRGCVQQLIACCSTNPDPPLRRVGQMWEWIGRRRAWRYLAKFVTQHQLDTFQKVILTVLGEIDPRLELTPEKRWMAACYGRTRRYSEYLRKGLADALALMAAEPRDTACAANLGRFVAETLRKLFGDETQSELWYSLADVLPTLAEAAPDLFLDMVERDVLKNQETRNLLLQEESPLGGGHRLCHLLWALERLAWSPAYLSRVGCVLAALHKHKPITSTGNTPENSLRDIFWPWHPSTCASVQQRLDAIDALARHHQEEAFELCIKLMPGRSPIGTPTAKPKWRDWAIQAPASSWAEYEDFLNGAFERLLAWVGTDDARWSSLLDAFPQWTPNQINLLLEKLEQVDVSVWNDQQRENLRRPIRRVLHRILNIENYRHKFIEAQIDLLGKAYNRLEPEDVVQRFAWLFDFAPDLLSVCGDDWRAREEARKKERQTAVAHVVQQYAPEDLLRLAEHVQDPWAVGYHTGQSDITDSSLACLLATCLDSEEKYRLEFAAGAVWGRFQRDGWDWVNRLFASEGGQDWPAARNVRFACALPFEASTWNWVESLPEAVSSGYWTSVRPHPLPDGAEEIARVVRMLLRYRRPFSALEFVWGLLRRQGEPKVATSDILLEVLGGLISVARGETEPAEPVRTDDQFGFMLDELLGIVEAAGVASENELAQVEWV